MNPLHLRFSFSNALLGALCALCSACSAIDGGRGGPSRPALFPSRSESLTRRARDLVSRS